MLNNKLKAKLLAVALTGLCLSMTFSRCEAQLIAASDIVFYEDFEAYESGSLLTGEGGWTGESSPIRNGGSLAGTGNFADGRTSAPPQDSDNQTRTDYLFGEKLRPDTVYTLSYDAYAFSTDGITHNTGVGLRRGDPQSISSLNTGPQVVSNLTSPGWYFGLGVVGGETEKIPGHYDQRVTVTVVLDPVRMRSFGRLSWDTGSVETTHGSLDLDLFSEIDGLYLYTDWRGFSNGSYKGAQIDNIRLTAEVVSDYVFYEDFEAYENGSFLADEGGWTGESTPIRNGGGLAGTGNFADGRTSVPPQDSDNQTRTDYLFSEKLRPDTVYTLSYDAYAFSTDGITHNTGVAFRRGDPQTISSLNTGPQVVSNLTSPGWFFGLDVVGGETEKIPGHYDERVTVTVVLDPIRMRSFGRLSWDTGSVETAHGSLDLDLFREIDGLYLYTDWRGFSNGSYKGAHIDNIRLTAVLEDGDSIPHPADTNEDFRIGIAEITAYGAAWKTGQVWPVGPNPIPIDYLTRAGAIWKNGEAYIQDSSLGDAPLSWDNIGAIGNRLRGLISRNTGLRQHSLSPVKPDLVEIYDKLESQGKTIQVNPSPNVDAWAIEIYTEGVVSRVDRFGPFFGGSPVTLDFEVGDETAIGIARLSMNGASLFFALENEGGFESREISLGAGHPSLQLRGVSGAFILERSSDLLNWESVENVRVENGTLYPATNYDVQFFRLRGLQ